MTREVISTTNAPAAVGPYSQAIKTGDLVFTAGQLGIDPATGKFVDGDVTDQARQALKNMKAILEEAGTSMEKVIKVTVFLQDMNDFKAVNEVYGGFFTANPPARSAVEVAALPLGGLVEMEAIATL
jgi:2-iminobutanoate/2-iminopropanoate deaminase